MDKAAAREREEKEDAILAPYRRKLDEEVDKEYRKSWKAIKKRELKEKKERKKERKKCLENIIGEYVEQKLQDVLRPLIDEELITDVIESVDDIKRYILCKDGALSCVKTNGKARLDMSIINGDFNMDLEYNIRSEKYIKKILDSYEDQNLMVSDMLDGSTHLAKDCVVDPVVLLHRHINILNPDIDPSSRTVVMKVPDAIGKEEIMYIINNVITVKKSGRVGEVKFGDSVCSDLYVDYDYDQQGVFAAIKFSVKRGNISG